MPRLIWPYGPWRWSVEQDERRARIGPVSGVRPRAGRPDNRGARGRGALPGRAQTPGRGRGRAAASAEKALGNRLYGIVSGPAARAPTGGSGDRSGGSCHADGPRSDARHLGRSRRRSRPGAGRRHADRHRGRPRRRVRGGRPAASAQLTDPRSPRGGAGAGRGSAGNRAVSRGPAQPRAVRGDDRVGADRQRQDPGRAGDDAPRAGRGQCGRPGRPYFPLSPPACSDVAQPGAAWTTRTRRHGA